MDLQICVPPPPARQLGAPPPPPATPPPPNHAQLELLATQDHLGQPSSKTHFTSTNLSTETNDSHFQCNTDALIKEPILNSVGVGFPSLAEHPPCSMPSSSNEAGRGRSSVRELSPRRLENPWRLQGDIDGAEGYSSSELITDRATGCPSYDSTDDSGTLIQQSGLAEDIRIRLEAILGRSIANNAPARPVKEPILNSAGIDFASLVEHAPCSMPSSSNEAGRGRSSVHELNPWRLENPWRDTGNIDGADGYRSSELSSEEDESTDHSGNIDGADGYPRYDLSTVDDVPQAN